MLVIVKRVLLCEINISENSYSSVIHKINIADGVD
jgi:hypothetical protein